MDNELHALTSVESDMMCETCIFFKQWNAMQGLCDCVTSPYAETDYDFKCDHWSRKEE